jgi:Ca2+-binding EF-hand superfamily protein
LIACRADVQHPLHCRGTLPRAWLAVITCALLTGMLPCAAQGTPNTRTEYLRMLDTDGDGRISSIEYVHYMSAGFRAMDHNGDGTLEPAELPGGQGRAIALREFQGNLRRQFRRLDRNRDGYLNARELTAPPG